MQPLFARCQVLDSGLCLAAGFACLAGWTDTVCVAKFNCFATLMIGNIVFSAQALASSQTMDALSYLIVIASSVLGAAVLRTFKCCSSRAPSYIAAPVVILFVVGADFVAYVVGRSIWIVCLVAPAFAAHGSLLSIATSAPQKFGHSLFSALAPAQFAGKQEKLALPACAFISLLVGCAIGVADVKLLARDSWVLTPVALLQSFLLLVHDRLLPPDSNVHVGQALTPLNGCEEQG